MSYKRGAIIATNKNRILLMYRKKNGREYYVIPGGHCKEKEDAEECAIREFKEETSMDVEIDKLLFEFDDEQSSTYYFLAKTYSGKPILSGPEAKRQSEQNFYELVWMPIKKLEEINLMPPQIDEKIIEELN